MPHPSGAPRRAAPLATPALAAGASVVAVAAALALHAPRAAAQPVLGPGDDATIPAPGQVRVRAPLTFGAIRDRAGGRTGGGTGRVALGSEFSLDSLTPAQLPGLAAARDSLRLATGVTGLGLSAGTLRVRARANTTTAPVLTEVGVTRWLAVSVLVPYSQTRTTVDVAPNVGGGSGNFGINPTRTSGAAAAAAQEQTRLALDNLQTAASRARAQCPTAAGGANCTAALAAAAAADRVRTQLASVYGTGNTTSGAAVVPLVNSDAQNAVAQRIAQLGAQFAAAGVTGFNSTAVPAPSFARLGLPGLRTLLSDPALGLVTNAQLNPFTSAVRAGLGDMELAASVKLFDRFGPAGRDRGVRARVTPAAGVRARATVTGGVRLPTGLDRLPILLFDLPPAQRATAVLARGAADVAVGRRASASFVARAAFPLADRRTLRIPLAPGQPFAPLFAEREVGRKLGRELELEVTPRYATGESFAVVAQAVVRHRAAAEFTGTYALTAAETGGDPVTLDASALGVGTGGRDARVGVGASYSTVAASVRRRGVLPLEVSYLHSVTAVATGGAVPYVTSDQLSLRVYVRLFGR